MKYILTHLFGTLVFFSVIFISAGMLMYPQGILYVVIGVCMSVVQYTVLRIDRTLLDERAGAKENTQSWDTQILLLSFVATLAMYVVAGLDSGRFHWSPPLNVSVCVIGAIMTMSGQMLFMIAQKQNAFFSSTVRIQHDRGHAVHTSGLYTVVRHPAYLGLIVQSLGFPLLFGSVWSCIPVAVSVVLTIVRTYKEDLYLQKELSGYHVYAQKVRSRLIPSVW